jgi:hypothetical protein
MAEEYTLESLESDLYDLALKMHEIDTLEQTIEQFWAAAAVQAIPFAGTVFWQLYTEIQAQNQASIISADSDRLGQIPNRCRRIVGIDHHQFEDAQQHFESVALDMVDFQGAPGNVLSNIGNWNGAAAEAFEEYFSGYEPAQARQAALLLAQINACASLTEIVKRAKEAVRALLDGAKKLADDMIAAYKESLKDLTVALVVGVVTIAAAGFGVAAAGIGVAEGAAGGAAALTGAIGGSLGSLSSSVYTIEQVYVDLEARSGDGLIDSVSDILKVNEDSLATADDEIYADLELIRSEWSISQIAIPAPPGSDEVSGDSFHHESAS